MCRLCAHFQPLLLQGLCLARHHLGIFCSPAHILLYLFVVYVAMTQGQRKHWLRGFTPSTSYKVSADRKDRKHHRRAEKRYTTHRRQWGVMHGTCRWKRDLLSKLFSSFFWEEWKKSCSWWRMGTLTSTKRTDWLHRLLQSFYGHYSWVMAIINVEIFKIPITIYCLYLNHLRPNNVQRWGCLPNVLEIAANL